ncbi:MAG: cyclodeaminase/cyclohydrolase family protein, partial [Candidatus Omnitrophota bacterium]|nr:cyclodeaminase/cyclohydrolase family protein [Candidatus Omnitrophota bacterium]
DIEKHISSLKTIRGQFTSSIDEDVLVYSKIRDAFKKNDKKIIDKSLKDGYDISLKICKLAKDAMKIALDLSSKGNPNLITDVGCGAELLNAAFSSSIFNCKINLKSLEDKDFVSKESLSLAKLVKEIDLLYKDTIKKTNNIL